MAQTRSRFTPEREDPAQKPPRCPACGGESAEKAFETVEPGFELLVCPSCGLGRTWPPVAAAAIGRYYPETYYGKENIRFNALIERLTRLFRRRRARVIRKKVAPGAALDVGCGRGLTLGYLRSLGFAAHGMEFSDTAAWHARQTLGLEVETGDFLKSAHQKNLYDVVIFWHSLEHLPRPVEALERARELLKPGGLLAVAVPNFSSLQATAFGRHWFHLDVPRHYHHFSEKALEAILIRHRFQIVQSDHFSFEQNPYGWLQSFYNALGFDNNLLYSILKNNSARTHQLRKHPAQAALIVALMPALTLLSLILTVVEAGLRRGGTIEVYAVKQ